MSQLNVDTIKKADGTGNLSVPAETGTVVTTASPSLGRRNMVLNGSMAVAQRGTSETGVTSMKYANAPDHYQLVINAMGAYTASQSTDAPDGFANSYRIECTTADASPAASDYFFFWTKHEGQDVQHLKFGTASAQQLTLSFWIKSNMTGTWQVNFRDKDSGRLITGTYTTNSADTWEYKTITIDGDTGGSGFTNDNNESFSLEFVLGAGNNFTSGTAPTAWEASVNANRGASNTVNIASSTSNYWAITGVQLEVGSVATPFEHRSYGEELALCQRYYITYRGTNNAYWMFSGITDAGYLHISTGGVFPTEMRAAPSVTIYSASGDGYIDAYGRGQYGQGNAGATENTTMGFNTVSLQAGGGSATGNAGAIMRGGYRADAEL